MMAKLGIKRSDLITHWKPSPPLNQHLPAVSRQNADTGAVGHCERKEPGEIWLDRMSTAEVIRSLSKNGSRNIGARQDLRERGAVLSPREREVVGLIAQGFKNRDMAERLLISEQTVKNHLHNIFDKLGVSDRLELALYAIHHKLHDSA